MHRTRLYETGFHPHVGYCPSKIRSCQVLYVAEVTVSDVGSIVRTITYSSISSYADGFMTRPRNKIVPVTLSRMRKKKGWSAAKSCLKGKGFDFHVMVTTVAAVASVPISSTPMKALWMTSDTHRGWLRLIPRSWLSV